MNLPEEFTNRMRELLKEEYEEFLDCYGRERKQGLRVNTGKISVQDFLKLAPFELRPIPWTDNGFYYRDEDHVTKHPYYYAGLYYVQEPSAMVPASRLPVEPGDRVLDLCAAPGGKATELGARLKGRGLLVANDISVSRAQGLLKNIEMFGIANACVTGEKPENLAERFGDYFDRILVDAPCSGEGMFRKDPALIRSWQERGPEYYAPLQKEILSCAVRMLRPGGLLLYSTCTFAQEEDEQVIAQILARYPGMELADCAPCQGFAPGIAVRERPDAAWDKCVRIWPHRMEGEGHFAALLRKREEDVSLQHQWECESFPEWKQTGIKDLPEEAGKFLDSLKFPPLGRGTLFQNKDQLFLLPEGFQMPKLRYLRTGLLLGTLKNRRFEPSQALAMALKKEEFSNALNLPADHPGVLRYLKGETLDLPETEKCASGWVLVCCDGYPLGWGKCVNGTLRNKYQPGWRML